MLLNLFDIARQGFAENKLSWSLTGRSKGCCGAQRKEPDISAAIDHNIRIKAAIKAVDIVRAKLARAHIVRAQVGHSQKCFVETFIATVANRQGAVANK